MSQLLKAIYRKGVFIPQKPCHLPEETEVEVIIDNPYLIPPEVTDPQEREQILKSVLKSMQENPLPANAPRFKREQLINYMNTSDRSFIQIIPLVFLMLAVL